MREGGGRREGGNEREREGGNERGRGKEGGREELVKNIRKSHRKMHLNSER